MKNTLRALFRLMAISVVFPSFAMAGLIVQLVFFRSDEQKYFYLAQLTHFLGKSLVIILNMRCRIDGLENVVPNALVVSNHVGTPDVLALSTCFPAFFVAKSEVRSWPLLGYLTRLGSTLFVDRGRRFQLKHILRQIVSRMKLGYSVVLFPEAGVTDGTQVVDFKSSPFQAAVETRRPVLPIAIRYGDGNSPTIACWFNRTFSSHVWALLKNPVLDTHLTILPAIADITDRRILARESRRQILEAWQKMR